MEAVFLSDLHLTSMEERNGQTLLRFFRSLEALPKPPTIFLLGDIFDLWVSGHGVFVHRYQPLLDSLKILRGKGARIIYFEGNHDLHLAPFWKEVLGSEVYVAAQTFEVGGVKIRCEHGDEMNLEDTAYLRLRAFLRHPFLERLAHLLPGKFWDFLGQRWSRHSRVRSSSDRADHEEKIRSIIRSHAERVANGENFDVVISGHMHVRDDWNFEKNGRSFRSINLGSWFYQPKVLVLENGQFEWRNL